MPAASSITRTTCAMPSGHAPRPCARSDVPHAEMVRDCNLMFVVRRVKLDYLRPARLDDALEVVTEPLELRAATVTLRQDIQGASGSCAVVEIELACVTLEDARPARIPPRWRAAFEGMLAVRLAEVLAARPAGNEGGAAAD